MKKVLVGTKHQIVIPKSVRQKVKGIRPGVKVNVYSIDEETIAVKVAKKDWVKRTYGIMKDAWKDIDPIAELEKIRTQWDEKS